MGFKTHIVKIIILLLIIINGCDYENPVNNQGNVKGKLVSDFNGFPLKSNFVALNSAPIITPNAFGEFYFENVSTPFDLSVFFIIMNPVHVTIFKNISNRLPILQCLGDSDDNWYPIVLRIKNCVRNQKILVKFLSKSLSRSFSTGSNL